MKYFDKIQNNIDEEIQKNDILTHYKLLAFFLFRKFAISDNKKPVHGADIKQLDNKFDFVISRGVIEHVPIDQHEKFISECFRIMKPNGIGYLTSSPWYAPWAGHQLAPFHIFPIKIAYLLTNLFFKTQSILIIPFNFKSNYYTRQNI